MTAGKLRSWRGVKPVAAPAGVAISTRLRTSADDELVLDRVAWQLGVLRRADLAATCRRVPVDARLSDDERRRVRRDGLNARKKGLTAQSSARWANAIIAGNDDQMRQGDATAVCGSGVSLPRAGVGAPSEQVLIGLPNWAVAQDISNL